MSPKSPPPKEAQGAVGIADLLRALAALHGEGSALEPEQLAAVGDFLGYALLAPSQIQQTQELRPEDAHRPSQGGSGPSERVVTEGEVSFEPVPFLRQIEAVRFGEPRPEGLDDEVRPRSRTRAPLAALPLPKAPSRWRTAAVVPRLYRLVSNYPRVGALDFRRVVRDLSEVRAFERVARRPRRRMVDRLRVILDRSISLAPFWSDGDFIADWLMRWGPVPEVEVCRVPWGSPQWPAPDRTVRTVVVSDAGMLRSKAVRCAWEAEGFRRTAAGERTVLWVLGPKPRRRSGGWHRVVSEGRASRPHAEKCLEEAAPLLALASLAHQVDAPLLRELRLVLGLENPAVELWAWRHPDLRHGTTAAARWTSEGFLRYREALRKAAHARNSWLTVARLRQALRCIAKYRVVGTPGQKRPLIWWAPESVWQLELSSWLTWAEELPSALAACIRDFVAHEGWLANNDAYLKMLQASARGSAPSQAVDPAQLRLWLDGLKLYEPPRSWSEEGGRFYSLAAVISQAEPTKRYLLGHGSSGLAFGEDLGERTSPVAALESASSSGTFEARGHRQTVRIDVPLPADLPAWSEPPSEGWDAFGRWSIIEIAGVPVRMRWIEAGSFMMGSPKDEEGRYGDEEPQHEVTLAEGFWLAEVPCTQALWRAVMGENPSEFEGRDRPVEHVSHDDVLRFLDRVNEGAPELDVRLPTEAQWEYACRAGTTGARYVDELEAIAWYADNANGQTHPVGQKRPNPWGLYDMLGNVWEWCRDGMRSYDSGHAYDPIGPMKGGLRVLRGGGWGNPAENVRAAARFHFAPSNRSPLIGFRLSRGPGAPSPASAGGRPGVRGTRAQGADPEAPGLRSRISLRTDRGGAGLDVFRRPEWASVVGRDRFGLFAEVEVEAFVPVCFRMRWIAPGTFMMGSPEGEEGRLDWEGPQHSVTLTSGFWMAETPCTQALWTAVMGEQPSKFSGDALPVDSVSHEDATRFISTVNASDPRLDLRLPTEAEWEYACRAGNPGPGYGALEQVAWYGANSERMTHPVASKKPNTYGLHDMLGNVWEWCLDGMRSYDSGHAYDPIGPMEGGRRVLRGGSWYDPAGLVRAACRYHGGPSLRCASFGFRLSRGPGAPSPASAGGRPGVRGTRAQGAEPEAGKRDKRGSRRRRMRERDPKRRS